MQRIIIFLTATAMIVLGLAAAPNTLAANATWTGTSDTGSWTTTANWGGTSPVPGTGDTATFNSAGGALDTIDLGIGVTINQIIFDTASVAAYTIGAGSVNSQTLTLNNGGSITANNNISASQLFNATIVLGSDATAQSYWINNNDTGSKLTFAGNIRGGNTGTPGTKTLTVTTLAGGVDISGTISDGGASAVALTKLGTGTLTLSGANTYSGATIVRGGGRLVVTGTGAIAPSTGAALTIGASSGTGLLQYESSAISTFGAINVGNGTSAAGTLTQTAGTINASALTLSSTFSSGTGNVTIGNASGNAAVMNVSGNVVVSGATSGNTSTLTVNNTGSLVIGGWLTFGNNTTRTAKGIVTQAGGYVSAAYLNLASDTGTTSVTHSGTYSLNGGVLNVGSITIGTATLGTVNGVFIFNGGTLKATGPTSSFWADSASITASIGANGGTIDDGGYAITIGQVLQGAGSLTKGGAGALTLSGNNSYTGLTTVGAGTLIVNGTLSSSGAVDVTGGTLAGIGTVGAVTIQNGGTLAPGDAGVGNFHTGNLTLANGAKLAYGLATPSTSDQVITIGTLALNGQQFSDFNFTNVGGLTDGTYVLVDATALSGALALSGLTGSLGGGFNGTLALDNVNKDLLLTVIPEPSALALVGLGLLALVATSRRFRHTA